MPNPTSPSLSPQPPFERGAKGGCGEDFLKPSLSDTDSV
ncbi:hypothetical protein CKA32_003556 [Geitlerinema sp. FC II]|nr:hypothetical protein CKA32_003556 [Geitlerinema sp. FC II]